MNTVCINYGIVDKLGLKSKRKKPHFWGFSFWYSLELNALHVVTYGDKQRLNCYSQPMLGVFLVLIAFRAISNNLAIAGDNLPAPFLVVIFVEFNHYSSFPVSLLNNFHPLFPTQFPSASLRFGNNPLESSNTPNDSFARHFRQ